MQQVGDPEFENLENGNNRLIWLNLVNLQKEKADLEDNQTLKDEVYAIEYVNEQNKETVNYQVDVANS